LSASLMPPPGLNPLLNGALVQHAPRLAEAVMAGLNPLLNGALVQQRAEAPLRHDGCLNPLLNGALVQPITRKPSVLLCLNPLLNGALVQLAGRAYRAHLQSQSPSERGSGSTVREPWAILDHRVSIPF